MLKKRRGFTVIREDNIVYEWKIKNFSAVVDPDLEPKKQFIIDSPEFVTGITKQKKRLIHLVYDSSDNINLSLRFKNSDDWSQDNLKYSIYVVDSKNEKQFLKNSRTRIEYSETTLLILSRKRLLANKEEYLPDNTLTVMLELTVYDDPATISLNIPSKHRMNHDYRELYNTKLGSDVVIKVSDKEFQAHKAFLIARSSVLAAMFSHDLEEKKTNKIDITDISSTIFEKLLEYIYTDEVTDLDSHADELLEAADKYQLESLKNMCQESISNTLTIENALKIKNLATLHNAKELVEFATSFMASDLENFVKTQSFQKLKEENPILAFELFESLTFSQKTNNK